MTSSVNNMTSCNCQNKFIENAESIIQESVSKLVNQSQASSKLDFNELLKIISDLQVLESQILETL